ncbi:hypothetical protein GGR52DRAFT_535017 [Hypoxylon sp. FL1284]|nr:hypothetical protein GGR52DRAFT_535017 [Hypoxylon sp. FL1284]
MERLAPTLLAIPPGDIVSNADYHHATKQLSAKLSKLSRDHSEEIVANAISLLDLLDPSVHSLSYLVILNTTLKSTVTASATPDELLEKLTLFLLTFDARQCRYAGNHLQELLALVGGNQVLPPSVAVNLLAQAILKIDPTGSMLTTTHIHLARLAYTTNNIDAALPVITRDIVFFPDMANTAAPINLCDLTLPPPEYISRETGLTGSLRPSQVMEYDLFCGMMYCSRREWAKACAAYERVISFPTREGGVSKIMTDCYKRWVLLSLLTTGKLGELRSHASAPPTKVYGSLAKPYTSLAVLFVADDARALKEEVEKNTSVWAEDLNTGLVREVLAAYQQWRVLGLEQIYSKVSLSEIRRQTTSAETGAPLEKDEDVEMLLQNMIIEGMLSGVIEKNDDGTTFLTFLSPSMRLSEQDVARELAGSATRLSQLRPLFKATRNRLGTSHEYIRHMVLQEKRTDKADTQMAMAFDTQVDDEDLMGGIIPTGY